MNFAITLFEIAMLIVLPLILFYQWRKWTYTRYIPAIAILYVIWYLTYSLLHELSHMLGVWITQADIQDFQLIPHFWQGDFGTGYIKTNYQSKSQEFIGVIMAYVRDIIFLFTGYLFLKRKTIKNAFLTGLVLVLLILSPTFDIINNYTSFLLGALNDFNAIRYTSGSFISNAIGIIFSITGIIITVKIMVINRDSKTKSDTSGNSPKEI